MEPGATVRCIHPDGRILAKDKLYAVLGREGDWIVVQDDWGRKGRYPTSRFAAVRKDAGEVISPKASHGWPDPGRRAPKLSILRSSAPLRR